MSEINQLKKLRQEEENQFIDMKMVESLGRGILDSLTSMANKMIFEPAGGQLVTNLPLDGSPNARAITFKDRPLNPIIEIRLSMLREIYRDAFTFPLIAQRIATETDTIKNLHKDHFEGAPFLCHEATPNIPEHFIPPSLKVFCLAFADIVEKKGDKRIGRNEVYCRFLMFELMLTWTFFHELSHLLQKHFLFKTGGQVGADFIEINEMSGTSKDAPDVTGQALELLADAEGLLTTLSYLKATGRIREESLYFLLCSTGCMFQRFYNRYDENLDLANGQHPHPVIRDEMTELIATRWMFNELNGGQNNQGLSQALTYFSVRASVMTGLFRAQRIESFEGEGLPSYMTLQTGEHQMKRVAYVRTLKTVMAELVPKIKADHLVASEKQLEFVFDCISAYLDRHASS